MKINVTVGELLQMAKNCVDTGGSCYTCVLRGFCTGYADLEKLCRIENAAPEITMKVNDTPVMIDGGREPVPKENPGSQIENTSVSSPKIGRVERTVDEMVDNILAAGDGKGKRPSNNKEAAETKQRVRRLLSEGVGEYGDKFIDRLYAVGGGVIEREELLGMVSGIKYPIALWRIAEQVYNDAGY